MLSRISMLSTNFMLKKNLISLPYKNLYKYGFELFYSTLFTAFSICILGILLFKLSFSTIFIIVFTSLRLVCGGYHAKTFGRCFFYSNLFFIIAVYPTHWIITYIPTYINLLISIAAGIATIYTGPVLDIRQTHLYKKREDFHFSITFLCFVYICSTMILSTSNHLKPYAVIISNTMLLVTLLQLKGHNNKYIYIKKEE